MAAGILFQNAPEWLGLSMKENQLLDDWRTLAEMASFFRLSPAAVNKAYANE